MRWTAVIIFMACLACTGKISKEHLIEEFESANQALATGKYKEAIKRYDAIIDSDPDFAAAYNNRGIAYYQLGSYESALVDYSRAIELQPEFYDAAFNRTNALVETGRWLLALQELELLTKKYDSASLFIQLGLIYTEKNHLLQAKSAFDQALSLDSSNIESWINRGNVHYYLGRIEKAVNDIKKALIYDSLQLNALNTMALLEVERQSYESALSYIDLALREEPRNPYFLNNKGFIYLQLDSLQLAEDLINKSLVIKPDNSWALRNKGIWHLKKGEPEKALAVLKQAGALDPFDTVLDYYYYLGTAFKAMGALGPACEAWAKGKNKNQQTSIEAWNQSCNNI